MRSRLYTDNNFGLVMEFEKPQFRGSRTRIVFNLVASATYLTKLFEREPGSDIYASSFSSETSEMSNSASRPQALEFRCLNKAQSIYSAANSTSVISNRAPPLEPSATRISHP